MLVRKYILFFGIFITTDSNSNELITPESENRSDLHINADHFTNTESDIEQKFYKVDNKNNYVQKNVRRPEKFTSFIQNVIEILSMFDDSDLMYFFNVLSDELSQYNYRGCKFDELLNNSNFRIFITEEINALKNLLAVDLRKKLFLIYNTIENEMYNEHEQKLVVLLNSLYTKEDTVKFENMLNDLDGYLKTTEVDMPKIVRTGVRSILFDHYTKLDDDKRLELKSHIYNYWMNVTNKTKDDIASDDMKIVQKNQIQYVHEINQKIETTKQIEITKKDTFMNYSHKIKKWRKPTAAYYEKHETDRKKLLRTDPNKDHTTHKHKNKHTTKNERYTYRQLYVEKDNHKHKNSNNKHKITKDTKHKSKKHKKNKTHEITEFISSKKENKHKNKTKSRPKRTTLQVQPKYGLQTIMMRSYNNNIDHIKQKITAKSSKHDHNFITPEYFKRKRYLRKSTLPLTIHTVKPHRIEPYIHNNSMEATRSTKNTYKKKYVTDAIIDLNAKNIRDKVLQLESEMNMVKLKMDEEKRIIKHLQNEVMVEENKQNVNNFNQEVNIKRNSEEYEIVEDSTMRKNNIHNDNIELQDSNNDDVTKTNDLDSNHDRNSHNNSKFEEENRNVDSIEHNTEKSSINIQNTHDKNYNLSTKTTVHNSNEIVPIDEFQVKKISNDILTRNLRKRNYNNNKVISDLNKYIQVTINLNTSFTKNKNNEVNTIQEDQDKYHIEMQSETNKSSTPSMKIKTIERSILNVSKKPKLDTNINKALAKIIYVEHNKNMSSTVNNHIFIPLNYKEYTIINPDVIDDENVHNNDLEKVTNDTKVTSTKVVSTITVKSSPSEDTARRIANKAASEEFKTETHITPMSNVLFQPNLTKEMEDFNYKMESQDNSVPLEKNDILKQIEDRHFGLLGRKKGVERSKYSNERLIVLKEVEILPKRKFNYTDEQYNNMEI